MHQAFNKDLLLFLFHSTPHVFILIISFSCVFFPFPVLPLINSSQGGYAAYRYAQPAAVATPAAAAAAAAAAAYSDR